MKWAERVEALHSIVKETQQKRTHLADDIMTLIDLEPDLEEIKPLRMAFLYILKSWVQITPLKQWNEQPVTSLFRWPNIEELKIRLGEAYGEIWPDENFVDEDEIEQEEEEAKEDGELDEEDLDDPDVEGAM